MTMKKKQEREKNALKRAYNSFNTGTRTMKSAKDYNRRDNKVFLQKVYDD